MITDAELAEKVAVLALEVGETPSRRRVMRAFGVGASRADTALNALTHPEAQCVSGALAAASTAISGRPQIAVEALVDVGVGAVRRAVPRWPILIIAAGAFVAIWAGWVGLGKLTGFGPVVLLPGIADEWVINSAITLPLGVEAYAAFAMWAWLSDAPVSVRARRFARWSALGALVLGASGQVAYHLLSAAGVTTAPWQITAFVSCLPVAVLGCAAALVHLLNQEGPS